MIFICLDTKEMEVHLLGVVFIVNLVNGMVLLFVDYYFHNFLENLKPI